MLGSIRQDQKMLSLPQQPLPVSQHPWDASRQEWWMVNSLLPVALLRGLMMGRLFLQVVQAWAPAL